MTTDTQLLHSFSKKDGTVFGDISSVQVPESGRVLYEVRVWFRDKEEASEYFNKAGGAYVP